MTEPRRPSGREKIEIKDLRNFVMVAEELNVSRAAKRLGMQQSPLSRSIKSLQEELGVRLVDTTSNRLTLTQDGLRMLDETKRVLQQVSNLYLHARSGAGQQHIRIGFTYSAGGNLARLMDRCRDESPDRVVSLIPSNGSSQTSADCDILLAPQRSEQPGVSSRELWKDDLWVAMPSGNVITAVSQPPLELLNRVGNIYYPSDLSFALGAVSRSARLIAVPYLDAGFVEGLMTSGNCTALIPGSLCRPLEQAGIILKPVADVDQISIRAYTLAANERGIGSWLASLSAA